ncbi:hypothetical protein EJ913_05315 [Azospirillum doebereinerae]|uniref:Ribbon-helix-helix domain-containing protein n=2 Tax=Azospirillum doebereinerae TaxID=92933 RepID=A0A3S0WP04_9PROT|nr:hypothetical protein EJ913_05315 [Azospirillum doebereinerae]
MAVLDHAPLVAWPLVAARTVPLRDRQTRLRLETAVWEGLDAIAEREGCPVKELCVALDADRPPNVTLSSAIRSYVLDYFRAVERA